MKKNILVIGFISAFIMSEGAWAQLTTTSVQSSVTQFPIKLFVSKENSRRGEKDVFKIDVNYAVETRAANISQYTVLYFLDDRFESVSETNQTA